MAKLEREIPGYYDFDEVLCYLHNGILDSSLSASYENSSEDCWGDVRCAVRVYERYTILGDNRLSLTVMLAGHGNQLYLSGITAAGSGGVGKIIPWGEEEFLNVLEKLADQLTGQNN